MSDAPIYFTSDNAAGMCPEVLQALIAANDGPAAAYGHDPLTQALEAQFAELFEYPVTVLLVSTGTAANALTVAGIANVYPPPFGPGDSFARCVGDFDGSRSRLYAGGKST